MRAESAQHDLAEVAGGEGAVDVSPEALLDEVRQVAAVVDVRVREDHRVDLRWVEEEVLVALVAVLAPALVEAAVEEDPLAVDFEEVLGARRRAGCAAEFQSS